MQNCLFEAGSPLGTRDTGGLPVLVTGAAGRIGSCLARHTAEKYRLRLLVHSPADAELRSLGEVVEGEIEDLPAMRKACEGMDTVVHLAAEPSPGAGWEELLQPNIIGTYNVLTAARDAGCRRVVFASSIHAVSGHPPAMQVKPGDPVSPGDLYGVSKCFGEALGRYFAVTQGLSVLAVRIGAFEPREKMRQGRGRGLLDAFVSPRDLVQLLVRCIEVDGIRFGIFHGVSGNLFNRLDLTETIELLGYAPEDDSTDLDPVLHDLHLAEKLHKHTGNEGTPSGGVGGS